MTPLIDSKRYRWSMEYLCAKCEAKLSLAQISGSNGRCPKCGNASGESTVDVVCRTVQVKRSWWDRLKTVIHY